MHRVLPISALLSAALLLHPLLQSSSCAETQVEAEPETSGQEELVQTELTGTQRKYELEISLSPRVEDFFNRFYLRVPVRFRYGITSNWQASLRLGTFLNNPFRGPAREGMSDVTIGTKYRWQRRLLPHVDTATSFNINIPTGNNDDISGGYVHYVPAITATRVFPGYGNIEVVGALSLDLLSGGPELDDVEEQDDSFRVALGVLKPSEPYNYSFEAEWISSEIFKRKAENMVYLTPGLRYLYVPKKSAWYGKWELLVGVRVGLVHAEEDFSLVTRLKWDFPLKVRASMEDIMQDLGDLWAK